MRRVYITHNTKGLENRGGAADDSVIKLELSGLVQSRFCNKRTNASTKKYHQQQENKTIKIRIIELSVEKKRSFYGKTTLDQLQAVATKIESVHLNS